MKNKLVIIGAGGVAQVAHEYFSTDSDYEVVGFSVEEKFIRENSLFGLPVVPYERLAEFHDPTRVHAFVAISYAQLNRLRKRFAEGCKSQGFRLASYVSSHAKVARSARIGEHCFILEDNVIQPFVEIGKNVVAWSGNHIGHHTIIQDDVFISSHVVIAGNCEIGARSFLGINSTISNGVSLAADNWLGPGCIISSSTEPAQLFSVAETRCSTVSTTRFFKLKD